MTKELAEGRELSLRVAKWLFDRERPDEAVAVLSVWATKGPNDAEGQNLLAEAFRIDPASRLAKAAFERMEGVGGEPSGLEAAAAKYTLEELMKLDAEGRRPTFRRAQMGFNNNVKYKGIQFHLQTEDSGLDRPHVITHLFADGGRVIRSHKRSYADEVHRSDIEPFVKNLMKQQHMEMALQLREGTLDDIIDGKAFGGLLTLTDPPRVDVQRLATRKNKTVDAQGEASAPPPPSVRPPAMHVAAAPARVVRMRLVVVRSLHGGPDTFEVGDVAILGTEGDVSLAGERFCHPTEAEVRFVDGKMWLEDLEGGNGVFLRIRKPTVLEFGDEFLVGDQLFRLERNPAAKDGPDPGPTYFYSSPKWISSFRIVQVFEGGGLGACLVARGNMAQIGSVMGDLIITDPLVSEQHCVIEEQAGVVLIHDFESRTGVFVRIKGTQELVEGDEIMIGRTRLAVEILAPA